MHVKNTAINIIFAVKNTKLCVNPKSILHTSQNIKNINVVNDLEKNILIHDLQLFEHNWLHIVYYSCIFTNL